MTCVAVVVLDTCTVAQPVQQSVRDHRAAVAGSHACDQFDADRAAVRSRPGRPVAAPTLTGPKPGVRAQHRRRHARAGLRPGSKLNAATTRVRRREAACRAGGLTRCFRSLSWGRIDTPAGVQALATGLGSNVALFELKCDGIPPALCTVPLISVDDAVSGCAGLAMMVPPIWRTR